MTKTNKNLVKVISNQKMDQWISDWLVDESEELIIGVLATVDEHYQTYSRTVAIREINQQYILFFTQVGSKKIQQLTIQPQVSITVVLSNKKRQITYRGLAQPLSYDENKQYWQSYSLESQQRFMVYGPKSGQGIENNNELDKELAIIQKRYQHHSPERPDAYVGYRITPQVIELYQLNLDRLSDSFVVERSGDNWGLLQIVP